jgi:hypothetical protein
MIEQDINHKQEKFCQAFSISSNATEAAKAAGYSAGAASNQGYRLLQRPEIVHRLEEIKATLVEDGTSKCFVYFIGALADDGLQLKSPVKIGVSKDVKERLRTLQTSNFLELSIIYMAPFLNRSDALEMEQVLHQCFEDNHVIGEWFNINKEILVCLQDYIRNNTYKNGTTENLHLCNQCIKNFIIAISKSESPFITATEFK